ncbi:four helix bundle protein [Proteinivorax hydrogeniformans]|uniref:four helix bundle protein n=1 Tax=Proteinivorax hydrogeniformans TaxID=1826727 RepID=UPI00338D6DEB
MVKLLFYDRSTTAQLLLKSEGTSRKSNKDRAHFINIAYGSSMELVCQMKISH